MRLFILFVFLSAAGYLPAAIVLNKDSIVASKHNRTVAIASGSVYAAGLIGLNQLWYSGYEKSKLHSFNDNEEWLQMDKIGHAYSTFTLTKFSYELYSKQDRSSERKAILYSGLSSFAFLTTIELMDGYSKEWGFSWGDFAANTAGIGIFLVQQHFFEKQIINLKYSFRTTPYSQLRPNTLGATLLEKTFKDYNGQTYWLSANLNGVFPQVKPKWLSVAVGVGAEAMVFGSERDVVFNGQRYLAERQAYLSLDVDWERIQTKKMWLKWVFKVANCIKIPAPAIELRDGSKLNYHWLYF